MACLSRPYQRCVSWSVVRTYWPRNFWSNYTPSLIGSTISFERPRQCIRFIWKGLWRILSLASNLDAVITWFEFYYRSHFVWNLCAVLQRTGVVSIEFKCTRGLLTVCIIKKNYDKSRVYIRRCTHDGLGKLLNNFNRLSARVCNLCAVRKSIQVNFRVVKVS